MVPPASEAAGDVVDPPLKGRDGYPLNLLAGSGNPEDCASKRRLVVEADFVTCTQ